MITYNDENDNSVFLSHFVRFRTMKYVVGGTPADTGKWPESF